MTISEYKRPSSEVVAAKPLAPAAKKAAAPVDMSALNAPSGKVSAAQAVLMENEKARALGIYAEALKEQGDRLAEHTAAIAELKKEVGDLLEAVNNQTATLREEQKESRRVNDMRVVELQKSLASTAELLQVSAKEAGNAVRVADAEGRRQARITAEACMRRISETVKREARELEAYRAETQRLVGESSEGYREAFSRLKKVMVAAFGVLGGLYLAALVAGIVVTFFAVGAVPVVQSLCAEYGHVMLICFFSTCLTAAAWAGFRAGRGF